MGSASAIGRKVRDLRINNFSVSHCVRGDFDKSVDASDFGTLIGAFNTDGAISGSGYDPTVDFNFDGLVDSSDFGLLIGEFNNTGAI